MTTEVWRYLRGITMFDCGRAETEIKVFLPPKTGAKSWCWLLHKLFSKYSSAPTPLGWLLAVSMTFYSQPSPAFASYGSWWHRILRCKTREQFAWSLYYIHCVLYHKKPLFVKVFSWSFPRKFPRCSLVTGGRFLRLFSQYLVFLRIYEAFLPAPYPHA